MSDSLPPRVGSLEQKVHTLEHRVNSWEEAHRDTPYRLTRLESALEDLPEIKRIVNKVGKEQSSNFALIKGIGVGLAILLLIEKYGPTLIKLMGVK